MEDRKRIVITGLGCVSPVGNTLESTWSNLVAGTPGGGPVTLFDASEHKCRIAAEVKGWDPDSMFGRKEARRMDRFTQFAMAAALEALSDSGLTIDDGNRHRIGAVIGSGIGGLGTISEQIEVMLTQGPTRVSPFLIPMMLPDTAGGMLAIHLGIRASNLAVVTACATGTNALGEAAEVIRRGQADVMFAGGAEASVIPIAMAGMASMTALSTRNDDPARASRPFDLTRDGFLMGEGGAIMLLESLEHAQARGARIYAEVAGYGSTNDAYHITAPAENGAGAVACMQMALDDANLQPDAIDYINAHGTSTQLNDKNETAAIKTVFGEGAYAIPVSSTKSMTGHMLGASGAMEALVCVKALAAQTIPPTINYETPDPACDLDYVPNQARSAELTYAMSNSFGFGGHNATIILARPAEAQA
ncbi:MAG: beta-ketoacyl-ACP synthase II [Chloroflexi bacterium]|nr:beta-ketoacyl-ACP synthase II [Chloroflexota bacterium]